ncbi:MAG TPA: PEP-CTERM sorting domain-containing protein [Verrucomicrobiae bacterium]|nr:PEP-CTERM sorting domain-containing protein [Verrucomicrobiae bacterium]
MKYLLAFASAITLSLSAHASAVFTIYDGVNPLISVTDNGPGDSASSIGAIVVETNVGVWALTINTGVTKPLVGSATSPVMDINLQAFSTGAGSLTLTFSDNGFGPASGIINATATGNTVMGPTATASMSVWGDQGNVVGAQTVPIASMPPTPLSFLYQTTSGPMNLNAPFSLTEVATINASGATLVNLDASFNMTSVPEPGMAALGALGLGGWILARRRRA